MRTYEEYRRILVVYEECGGVNETSRQTGIPCTTVHRYIKKYKTVANFEAEFKGVPKVALLDKLKTRPSEYAQHYEIHKYYAYVLGLYLGDGHISKTKSHGAHRIMIFLDKKYPLIIERCKKAIETLLPDNQVGITQKIGCVSVNCYYKFLPQVFPQHGAGKKHERPIILEDWQQTIVDQHPIEFFTGLYHSDGSRSSNIVNGKDYPRYTFSNVSDDIRKLFTDTTKKLGLSWTTANAHNVAVARREDVAWLDEHVGAKV